MIDLSNLLPAIEDACGLRSLREGLRAAPEPAVLGVPDAAKAAVAAVLARGGEAPTLVIVPKPPQALSMVEEMTAWLGDALPVFPFPERDALPYERLHPEPEALRDRLRAIQALGAGGPCVVIASGVALAQRTLPHGDTARITIELRVGTRSNPDELVSSLLRLGYRTVPLVELPGDAARRGGIVDVFPTTAEAPVRVEFLGDEIDSLRCFEAETQRSSDLLDTIAVGPAREVLDLPATVAALSRDLDLSVCRPEIRDRLEEELARLEVGDSLPDESFYVPFLASGCLADHLPDDGLLIMDEPADVAQAVEEHDAQASEVRQDLETRGELPAGLPPPHASWKELRGSLDTRSGRLHLSRWAVDAADEAVPPAVKREVSSRRLPFAPADAYGGRLRTLAADAAESSSRGRALIVVSQQAQRLGEVLAEHGVPVAFSARPESPQPGAIALLPGSLPHGWRLTISQPPLTLLTDAEVFGFVKQRRRLPRRAGPGREAFLAELSEGDHVVHIEHGIARFAGLVQRRIEGVEREYLELHYAQGDRLYVPSDQVDRVSRYVGPGGQPPSLSRLGSQEWSRAKNRVRRAVADLARNLLELHAARQVVPGRAFSPDTAWQQELEASFPYVETADQLAAARETKADLERARPMDRLVCGDVGYGKTEVALRAAFKTVLDGAQVAVLVPTTVLAQQHFATFQERLASFPVRVEMLSRFRTERDQQAVVEGLSQGAVDIVIGTHRLLQKDVRFKDLGLVVVDEEQRFGVGHKERLKQMRQEVDVLTLSATPIPRTLHMALSGIRDMSTMETPPEERLPIKTYVAEYDDRLVREAVLRELERGGQVYFVHNRVHDIELVAARLRELVPEAEVAIGHGQQPEEILERTMLHFVDGRIDVLVCTTIIESGLDIPNVNTIIIDKADKLGLAQLYQLRGRVGRGAARAYAYLLFDRDRALSEPAQKRLQAIFEATELGAGFQIALRDLEIRGAGNLLGAEQSGHIGAVGFDLYVRLLADAVERLKALREGRTPPVPKTQQPPLAIDLPLTAHLPASYVDDLNLRLALYQRMAAADTTEEADALAQELRDRFGPPPSAAQNLLYVVRLRALARQAGVSAVRQEEDELVVYSTDARPPRERLRHLTIAGLWTGPTQARLRLSSLPEDWPEALLDVLTALASTDEREAEPAR